MKKIAVLVDLTEGSKASLQQAKVFSDRVGSELVIIHVAQDNVPEEIHGNIVQEFVKPIVGPSAQFSIVIGKGNFMDEIPALIEKNTPDLVIMCTHGIHGIAQNLFGAHVLKLVQSIQRPCLVVQENSVVDARGPLQILLPASPFADFSVKLKTCAQVAKLFDAEVTHYEIEKYLGDTEEAIANNAHLAEEHMKAEGVKFKSVLEENKDMSLGHAQQTINYAGANGVNIICLSSKTHHEYMAMGKADKEKFLTNNKGIPVLCCG